MLLPFSTMQWIISDDDNVIYSHLRHKKDDGKEKGKLPDFVELEFMTDPGAHKNQLQSIFIN